MVHYKPKGRKAKAPPKAEFDFKYYTCNLSAEEMARIYGVKETTIYNWATMYRKEDIKKQDPNPIEE